MKSLLFPIILFFSGLAVQPIRADSSKSIPLPAVYCAVNELVETIDETLGSVVVIDPSTQTVVENSDAFTLRILDRAITSIGVPNPEGKGGIPYVYAGASEEEGDLTDVGVLNGSNAKSVGSFADIKKAPIALTSVIAGGTPYVYWANSDDDSDNQSVSVFNAKAFADNPKDAQQAVVGTISLKRPFLLTSSVVNGVSYVYCSAEDAFSVIDANAFANNPDNPEKAIIGQIKANRFTDLTSIVGDNGDVYIFCANDSKKVTVIRQKGDNPDKIENFGTITFDKPIRYLAALRLKNDSKSKDQEFYLYCASYFNKRIFISKIEEQSLGLKVKLIKTITLENDPAGLTTVEPISSHTVNNVSASKALKGGGSSVGGK